MLDLAFSINVYVCVAVKIFLTHCKFSSLFLYFQIPLAEFVGLLQVLQFSSSTVLEDHHGREHKQCECAEPGQNQSGAVHFTEGVDAGKQVLRRPHS